MTRHWPVQGQPRLLSPGLSGAPAPAPVPVTALTGPGAVPGPDEAHHPSSVEPLHDVPLHPGHDPLGSSSLSHQRTDEGSSVKRTPLTILPVNLDLALPVLEIVAEL